MSHRMFVLCAKLEIILQSSFEDAEKSWAENYITSKPNKQTTVRSLWRWTKEVTTNQNQNVNAVSYTHLTLPTIYSV